MRRRGYGAIWTFREILPPKTYSIDTFDFATPSDCSSESSEFNLVYTDNQWRINDAATNESAPPRACRTASRRKSSPQGEKHPSRRLPSHVLRNICHTRSISIGTATDALPHELAQVFRSCGSLSRIDLSKWHVQNTLLCQHSQKSGDSRGKRLDDQHKTVGAARLTDGSYWAKVMCGDSLPVLVGSPEDRTLCLIVNEWGHGETLRELLLPSVTGLTDVGILAALGTSSALDAEPLTCSVSMIRGCLHGHGRHLTTRSNLHNLRTLNVSRTCIGDPGISAIAVHCPNLQELNISGCIMLNTSGLKTLLAPSSPISQSLRILEARSLFPFTDECLHLIGPICYASARNIPCVDYLHAINGARPEKELSVPCLRALRYLDASFCERITGAAIDQVKATWNSQLANFVVKRVDRGDEAEKTSRNLLEIVSNAKLYDDSEASIRAYIGSLINSQ